MNRGLFLIALTSGLLSAQTADKPPASKPPDTLHELSVALESLSHRAGRAVVQIFSTSYVLSDDSEGGGNAGLLARQRSSGSGVIVSSDGYIVTNAHVVQNARRIQVQLSDVLERTAGRSVIRPAGKRLDAKIVGIDRESDLALIRIEGPESCRRLARPGGLVRAGERIAGRQALSG
jgi:S1-C subfamily serine protease